MTGFDLRTFVLTIATFDPEEGLTHFMTVAVSPSPFELMRVARENFFPADKQDPMKTGWLYTGNESEGRESYEVELPNELGGTDLYEVKSTPFDNNSVPRGLN